MNFLKNYDNTEILSQKEYNQRKKDLVEKYLTQENLKEIPEVYNILLEEYYEKYIIQMEEVIEYLFNDFRERFVYHGVLEKKNADMAYIDLIHIIFNNLHIEIDLDLVLNNETYVNIIFDEFQLKHEL